jgi:predicted metal-dependent hydrolase
MTAQG